MKTYSSFTRLCFASVSAFALTLSAAESDRREKAERPPDQPEKRESRRESRPESQAAPRDGERGEPRGPQRPTSADSRRPGAEPAGPQSSRPDGPAVRDGERHGPVPSAANVRKADAPRREASARSPMAGAHDRGNPGERQKHIREAIEHLRLAGLNDVAEHLQQNLSGADNARGAGQASPANRERGASPGGNRPSIEPPRGDGPPGRNHTPPMAGGSPNELRELQQQVGELRKMVEKLARQRR